MTSCPDTADSVAVSVEMPAASAIDSGAAASVTVGGASSSVIVIVCCWTIGSVPLVTDAMSTITVSSGSSNASCTAVTVTLSLRDPAGIRMVVAEMV